MRRRQKINITILDQKNGDYRDLEHWPGMGLPGPGALVHVLSYLMMAISPMQPPMGVSNESWINKFTELIAKSHGILSAQRILPPAIEQALGACPKGEYPSLKMINASVAKTPVGAGQRIALYRESLTSALTDLDNGLSPVFDYVRSDFLQNMFSTPGIFVIEAGELSSEHLNTFAHYLTQYLYSWKAANPETIDEWLHLIVYEDFSSLVTKQRSLNAGGATLLEDRGAKQRYLSIGGIYLVHGLSELAPLLLQNANLIVGMAPKREDDRVLQKVFGLSRDQIAAFKRMPRGMALTSSPVWPLSLPVSFPSPEMISGGGQ